jgi:hypothetical protein
VWDGAFDEQVPLNLVGQYHVVDPALVTPRAAAHEMARDIAHARPARRNVGIGAEVCQLQLEASGLHDVVGVHAREQLALGLAGGRTECGDDSSRGSVNAVDAVIAGSACAEYGGRVVVRAVIHRDNFEIGERLRGQGRQRLLQSGGGVTTRKQN